MVRKSDFFKQVTLKSMVEMVASVDINKNKQEWEEDITELNVQNNDSSSLALDAFSKIAPELGSKYLIPSAFPYIIMAVKSDNISHKYAVFLF
jgi:hypothetical protein